MHKRHSASGWRTSAGIMSDARTPGGSGLAVALAGHLELSRCGPPKITLAAAKARPIRLRKAPHLNSLGHGYF